MLSISKMKPTTVRIKDGADSRKLYIYGESAEAVLAVLIEKFGGDSDSVESLAEKPRKGRKPRATPEAIAVES